MAASNSEFAVYVAEQLRPLGSLGVERFFGGLAIKSGTALFAMIMDGTLYFSVDDALRAEYESLGSRCFSFASKKGRVDVKRFYAVPADILEDEERLVSSARRSLAAAAATAASRAARKPPKRKAVAKRKIASRRKPEAG